MREDISQDVIERILELRRKGVSIAGIMEKTGLSKRKVVLTTREHGSDYQPSRPVPLTDENKEALLKRLCQPGTVYEIAREMGMSEIDVAAFASVDHVKEARRIAKSRRYVNARINSESQKGFVMRRADQPLSDADKAAIRAAYLRGDEEEDIAEAHGIPKTYIVCIACYSGDQEIRRKNRLAARREKAAVEAVTRQFPSQIVEAVKMLRSGGMLINQIYKEVGISRDDVKAIIEGNFKTM
jgi:hypothetical protein